MLGVATSLQTQKIVNEWKDETSPRLSADMPTLHGLSDPTSVALSPVVRNGGHVYFNTAICIHHKFRSLCSEHSTPWWESVCALTLFFPMAPPPSPWQNQLCLL